MILDIIIAFLAIMVPGFFLALALLKKTNMHIIEIGILGFIFGLIFPPTMIWAEAYLIPVSSFFSFSAGLYNINVIILTIIGLILCYWQGALDPAYWSSLIRRNGSGKEYRSTSADYRQRVSELRAKISHLGVDMKILREHEREEKTLAEGHENEMRLLRESGAGSEEIESVKKTHAGQERRLYEEHEREEYGLISREDTKKSNMPIVWMLLLLLMLVSFASRVVNLSVPSSVTHFFEFDPYFDMISTQYILTYGYQLVYSHSAWPTLVNGTIQSIQPIVPYLEAYWYQIAAGAPGTAQISTSLLSTTSSVYPPITAALLVFVVFMYVYHEYGEYPALIAAALAAAMPTLISTFIAGEQLLEPWGIFALFFFFATYLLAVRNPDEKRYAILAGIAFVSTFLGSHYYTVDAGILALYIVVQGLIDVLRNKNSLSFYKMNAIVIGVIVLFYILYSPYTTAITDSIPSVVGIPTIVAFPLFALLIVAVFEYVPTLAKKYGIIKKVEKITYYEWLGVLALLVILLILFTPLGKPVKDYYSLSVHFTTPSIPLFMTVQEYAITGITFNFGSNGFGIIGASTFGLPLIIFLVLILFGGVSLYTIIKNDSKTGVLNLVIIGLLALAGLSEVKYLPHFGVAYILAIGILVGEAALYIKKNHATDIRYTYALYGFFVLVVLLEAMSLVSVFAAAANPSCSALSNANNTNVLGLNLYCNTVPQAWLYATAWMSANVGPYAPRILSWWDYGDWINWFGNSNAVIRGDNSVATLDYKVAAHYVLGVNDSYGPKDLGTFMDSVQAGYVLFDDQLIPKWSALDFLACVNVNQTSQAYASAQGQLYGQPFLTGTSQCEISHDPVDINIPASPQISDYCSFSNASVTAIKAVLTVGEVIPQLVNQTYCVQTTANAQGLLPVYTPNGTLTNIVISPGQLFYNGERQFTQGGPLYINFMALYLPNGPNDTVTNAPSDFYNSNYYRGFFFGKLPGFTLVYPESFKGLNLNDTNQIMIFKLNNFTGTLPVVVPKPSYVNNNYSIPG